MNAKEAREILKIKIERPIPLGNNLPLKNRRVQPEETVWEDKPVIILLAKEALAQYREAAKK